MKIIPLIFFIVFSTSSTFAGFSSQLKLKSEVTHQLQEANIYEEDNKQLIKNFEFPFSAVGQLSRSGLKDRIKGAGSCTASLISPDLILTNAHCVVEDGEIALVDAVFSLQFDERKKIRSPYQARITEVVDIGTKTLFLEQDSYLDWAILRLDRKLGHLVGWFAVRDLSFEQINTLQKTKEIHMAGYGKDRMQAVHRQTCKIKSMLRYDFVHNCTGSQGSSGSPIFFLEEREDGRQMGVIVALNAKIFRDPKFEENSKWPFSFIPGSAHFSAAVRSENFIKNIIKILKDDEIGL